KHIDVLGKIRLDQKFPLAIAVKIIDAKKSVTASFRETAAVFDAPCARVEDQQVRERKNRDFGLSVGIKISYQRQGLEQVFDGFALPHLDPLAVASSEATSDAILPLPIDGGLIEAAFKFQFFLARLARQHVGISDQGRLFVWLAGA